MDGTVCAARSCEARAKIYDKVAMAQTAAAAYKYRGDKQYYELTDSGGLKVG